MQQSRRSTVHQHGGDVNKNLHAKTKMESSREILTFQIGHYSNFVGAHLWNLQEAAFTNSKGPSDTDHDVLYREGWSPRHEQVTFTPRLLSVDLKGSLKHLRAEGELYDDCQGPDVNAAPWPSENVQVDLIEQQPEKNALQRHLETNNVPGGSDYELEDKVTVWSDYLVPRFHPRSVIVANEYQHNSDHHPFDIYNYGLNVWNNNDFKDEIINRIRQYMEECNNAQGFQLLTDGTNGFGGISAGLLEYLCDEFHNKSILAIPLLPPVDDSVLPLQQHVGNINFLLTLQKLTDLSSLVVPLSTNGVMWRTAGSPRMFPHLTYNPQLPYHTSAVLASAVDTFSLQYRLKNGSDRLSDLVNTMSWLGRKVATCGMCLPFGIKEKENLFEMLEKWEGPLWTSLTPHCDPDIEDISNRVWMQSVVVRGIPFNRLRNPTVNDPSKNQVSTIEKAADILRSYLAFSSHGTCSHVFSSKDSCFVTPPFPSIFKQTVGLNGDVLLSGSRHESLCVREVPSCTSISSSAVIGTMLLSLLKETSRLPISRFPAYSKAGLEVDDYKEIQQEFISVAENYDDDR